MAYQIIRRGLGDTAAEFCSQGRWNWLADANCWSKPLAQWQTEFASTYTKVPPAPINLTLPPASGADAAAQVQALADAQMRAQQAADAAGVDTNAVDQAASAIVGAGDALNPANWKLPSLPPFSLPDIPWGTIAIVGVVVVIGLAAIGGGMPRRYGR